MEAVRGCLDAVGFGRLVCVVALSLSRITEGRGDGRGGRTGLPVACASSPVRTVHSAVSIMSPTELVNEPTILHLAPKLR